MAMTPQRWSISALSVEFGLDRRTVAKRLKDVAPLGMDGRAKVYALADAAPRLSRPVQAGDDQPEELDPTYETARLKKAQADKTELEVEVLRGTLIPEETVSGAWNNFLANCRAKLLSLPTVLATRMVGLGVSESEGEARDLIYEALDELKDYDRSHYGNPVGREDSCEVRSDVGPAAESDGKRVGRPKSGSVKRGKRGTRQVAD